MSKLNCGDALYHSAETHPSSRLLTETLEITIYKSIILAGVLYGYVS
jgi:hypothetical protein